MVDAVLFLKVTKLNKNKGAERLPFLKVVAMSNKKLMLDSCVWDCPTAEEVSAVVAKLGGISSVCRITKKHRNTVSKWCNGSVNIDFANWSLIRDYELKTIRIGLSCSSYMEAVEKVVNVLKKYEMSHKDADEIATILKIAIVSSK